MSYRVILEDRAKHGLKQLHPDVRSAVLRKLLQLAADPRPRGARKLSGGSGKRWRIRVGAYRVLYELDDTAQTVAVFKVGPRGSVYRDLK